MACPSCKLEFNPIIEIGGGTVPGDHGASRGIIKRCSNSNCNYIYPDNKSDSVIEAKSAPGQTAVPQLQHVERRLSDEKPPASSVISKTAATDIANGKLDIVELAKARLVVVEAEIKARDHLVEERDKIKRILWAADAENSGVATHKFS